LKVDKSSLEEIESIISKIQGVVSGKLAYQNGEIVEIHILANSKRNPKQIVRDIESAILVKMGIEMDHKKISVAQLSPEEPVQAKSEDRYKFRSISYKAENGETEIIVTINNGKKSYSAKASGPNIEQNRLRLISTATLSAIEQCLNNSGTLISGNVQKIVLCGKPAIAVTVNLRLNHHEEILLGTALIKGDDFESTIRATLDAVNRRISLVN